VTQHKSITTKPRRLSAQDIYQLTVSTLQNYFPLDMDNSRYEDQDIWDVLIASSVERLTIESVCGLLEETPSPNTVRTSLRGVLPKDEDIINLEDQLNEMLVGHLPKKLFSKKLPCAADITLIPYHGQHEEDDKYIRRGLAKGGTTHFHGYATLFVVKNNKRYTLALTFVYQTDKALDVLKRLLKQAEKLQLRIKRLYLDRGFDNNGVVAFLKKQSFPAIFPLVIRGKNGGTRALLKGRKSYITTYTRNSTIYDPETFTVYVVCKYAKGRYKRSGVCYFAYLVIGEIALTPQQIYQEYRSRFGIETSYRLMNHVRARTASRSPVLRLFFVGIALLLLNLWSYVKWSFLFIPRRGHRIVFHHLLSLARWRLWLWEVVKQRLGFCMEIVTPLSP